MVTKFMVGFMAQSRKNSIDLVTCVL
jgi:hypothetical protein